MTRTTKSLPIGARVLFDCWTDWWNRQHRGFLSAMFRILAAAQRQIRMTTIAVQYQLRKTSRIPLGRHGKESVLSHGKQLNSKADGEVTSMGMVGRESPGRHVKPQVPPASLACYRNAGMLSGGKSFAKAIHPCHPSHSCLRAPPPKHLSFWPRPFPPPLDRVFP